MENGGYPRVLSDKEQKEWIAGCPVQVKRVRLTVPAEGAQSVLSATIVPCGGFGVTSVQVKADFEDPRHKALGTSEGTLSPGDVRGMFEGEIPMALPAGAVFAYVTVLRVVTANDGVWENPDGGRGMVLPEQRIIWQTDPHYEAIRHVTDGVVNAKYYPDEVKVSPEESAWRCACGQVNLTSVADCGACGCEKRWLDEHFDGEYLAKAAVDAAAKKQAALGKKKPKKSREGLSDKGKFIVILASAALVIGGIAVSPWIAENIRYAKAEEHLANGEYDLAIEKFTELGDFSQAADKLYEANYRKAQVLTGLDEVNMVQSDQMKCYSITSEGTLSFRPDDYTGDWTHFVIPDVVDGIVVRKLDKNFFINCKEMVEVTISHCVEELGDGTFFNCASLVKVNFGKNVRKLGARCFINCTALSEMVIPDTVEIIGLRAFNSCLNLASVTLGSGIVKIPEYLFSECAALDSVTVTGAITEIGAYAFAECGALRELVFHGTKEAFAAVEIGDNNEALLRAKVKYMK